MTPAIHLAHIYELLIAAYGEPRWEVDHDPLGGLVGTILSQHTSDINSGRAYQQLITALPTWEAVRDAPTYRVAELIKSGGLANIKAPRIQDVLHDLTERQAADGQTGPLSAYLLAMLNPLSPEEGWRYLCSFQGVGPKTAACVLLFHMRLPAMPVDTHVHRVSKRLGLIGPKVNAEQAHVIFARATPPEWTHTLHVDMIRHGRQVCHAQRPECSICPLYSQCAYVGSVDPQKTALAV